jgi:hypothetical protein
MPGTPPRHPRTPSLIFVKTPCFRRCSTISTTSPNQEGAEGMDSAEVWICADPSAILFKCTSLREWKWFFSLKEAHFYPCLLQLNSSLRIAWAHVGDESDTSFHSQISSVFKHPGKKDLYIALADRWITEYPSGISTTYQEVARVIEAYFNPSFEKPVPVAGTNDEVNTSVADYVWLPFRFDGKMAYLDWKDEWRVEDFD